jgi:hypothetical protein
VSESEIQYQVEELCEQVDVRILPATPPVLSVGRRCMEHGYSFMWMAGRDPIFVLPSGKRVALEVEGLVPYLRSGPNVACPVTFGPGVPARGGPARAPCPTAVVRTGTCRDEAPSGEPGADRNVGDQKGEAESESEAEAVLPELKLREQAVSLQHLLAHLPKNPYCEACLRAKARRSPAETVSRPSAAPCPRHQRMATS